MFAAIICLLTLETLTETMGHLENRKQQFPDLSLTEEELQDYFGVLPQNLVLDYEVSFLTPVNERGEKISQVRRKRDTANKKQSFYNISILGLSLHLNLTINEHLLAPSFHIETKHSNGSTTKAVPTHRNYYHGHVISYPGSTVALSGKDKLRGTVRISDDHMFLIHPLPDHLSKNYQIQEENFPHFVVKRSIADKQISSVNYTEDMNQTFIEKRNPEQQQSDGQDGEDSSKNKFLEVIYVADQHAIELYGLIELPEMLLSVANIVSKLIYGISLDNTKVIYVINKIRLINDGTFSYAKDAEKYDKLRDITKWARINNVPDDNNPHRADQTVLFTTHNNGELSTKGMATEGVVCRRYDASGMVSLNGLSSSFVTAHETGHSLGCGHDGDGMAKSCPEGTGIMSARLPPGHAAFAWSKCSRNFATKFLNSDESHCLDNMPTLRGPTQSPLLRAKLPGEVFDADKQCEMIFGAGRKQCSAKKSICSSLYCTRSSHTCSYILSPPADGTRCGDRHWCIHGECVDDGSPIINGNWGEWSEYGPCTRSCGGGVQHRTRKCNNPSPRNGGLACVGSSVGQHRMCNVKACREGVVSYRRLQCQRAGYSWAYYISKQACSLWCVRSWKIFHHGTVKDGTPCSNDPSNNDVCVGGVCQPVGCDSVYLSETEKDRCGVCGGGGFTCTIRYMYYDKNFWKFGMSYPFKMVVLKKGSANIHVKKEAPTWNWIGVRNMKGQYLIPLPTYSKTVYKAGTRISYIHKSSKFRDEIIIPGPIQEDLELVFVRIYEANYGVKIRFFESVDNPKKPPASLYTWKEYKWSKCSQSCGGGLRRRKVKCHRKDEMSVAGNKFCDSKSKPKPEESCDTPACPAEWFVTDWKPCSKRCGSGLQRKKIICRRKKNYFWIVEEDSACVKPRPVKQGLERRCNEVMCPPEYLPQAWSECSTSCDEGVSTRKLKCAIINKKGISEIVPVRVCEQNGSPKPQTTRRCNHDVPCQDKALNYALMGCFRDSKNRKSRLLPIMLENLRSKIDWHNPSATIDECAILASKKGKNYFAIQYYGECRTYAEGTKQQDYKKLGISHNFWAGLGGSWTNCVYKFL